MDLEAATTEHFRGFVGGFMRIETGDPEVQAIRGHQRVRQQHAELKFVGANNAASPTKAMCSTRFVIATARSTSTTADGVRVRRRALAIRACIPCQA